MATKSSRLVDKVKKFLDDTHRGSPLKFRYIVQMRIMQSIIASWPYKEFGRQKLDSNLSKYNLLLIFLACLLPFSGPAYMWAHRATITFLDMGNIILTMFLTFLYLQRIMLAREGKYHEVVRDFLLEFHLFYFRNRSKYAGKIFHRIHIISGAFTFYVIAQLYCGIFLYNFTPWYSNYKRGMFGSYRPPNLTFVHAVYYYSPNDEFYVTTSGYYPLFIFNIYMAVNVAGGLMSWDLLIALIVFQIWGHLKVLKQALYSFPPPKPREGQVDNGMYTAEENLHIHQLLRDCVMHHQLIIKFVDKCSNAFSEYLFMFYANIQVISCILLLEMSSLTAEALGRYGNLTLAVYISLIQCSCLFELLNTKSTQLIDAVYDVPWECMNTSNRRTMMFLLYRVQTPLSLRAAKVVPVGVQTMLAVIKTSFSYFMLLITVVKES